MAKKTRSFARQRVARSTQPTRSTALRRAVFATLRAPRFAGGSLLSGLLFAGTALANPQDGTVTAGAATIVAATPDRLNVVQTTDSAIINWRGFSIEQGEHTDFQQPSSSSVTLNRVTGNQASLIAGNLTANGIVMLVNPNGVVFGETGTVDVGGLVATTANIKDEDFLSRRMNFDQASPNAGAVVRNAGSITIKDQGLAALVAPNVQNSGVIQARLGKVALGGAQTFSLDFQGDGLLSFAAGSAVQGALASNSGRILADGGTVQLAASAVKSVVDEVINTSGVIEARSVSSQNGRIILSGGDSGTLRVAGSLDVSSEEGKGGDVRVSGDRIAVASDTHIDASGNTGGGRIDVGIDANGEWSGAVHIAHGAQLNADAGDSGNGGVINVLSNRSTVFAGHISARGGAQSGDGGKVEVSGKDKLSITGSVDLNAPNGRTGDLLLDPATLTITDTSASSGSQDSAAGDGTIAFDDPDVAQNTISRGTLEALSGNANITLEATGQIVIEAMANDLIDLQTDSDHSFTLRSTLIGGILFMDSATEIRTQGGDIILQALRSGELLNVGRLTTNGGDIRLTAAGVVQLANVLDASTGAVNVTSLANSIKTLNSSSIIGTAVTLDASYGNLGEADFALTTNTGDLTLATGGNLFVNNEASLSRLSIASVHAKEEDFIFQLTAPLLTFVVEDDDGVYQLHNVSNDGDLRFSFTGDNDMEIGIINAGSSDVALTSTEGSIFDDGDSQTLISGNALTVSSYNSIGGEGGSDALTTAVSTATLTASNGGLYLFNIGTLNLLSLNANFSSGVATTEDLTVGQVSVNGDLILASTTGSVASAGGPNGIIDADTLYLGALGGAAGSIGTPIVTNAREVNAQAVDGIYVSTTDSVDLGQVVSLNGPITIRSEGGIDVDFVDGGAGTVTLVAGEGGIYGVDFDDDHASDIGDDEENNSIIIAAEGGGEGGHLGPHVVAGAFVFDATDGVELETAVSSVTGIAGEGGIDLQQTGHITLSSLVADESEIEVTAQQGDITVASVRAESVFISADDGNLLDDGQVNTRIVGEDDIGLHAYFSIGTNSAHMQTTTSDLLVFNGGNFFVDNNTALEALSIRNFHDIPGAHTLELTSPYLRFDVIDTGSQYEVHDITGVTLYELTFQGDQTIVFSNVNTPNAEVDLIATQGQLLNDADIDSQIRADSLRLTTGDGDIGEIGGNGSLQVNTDELYVRATGDVLVTDLTDLYTLSILHRHDEDVPEDYQFAVTAPSLRFDVVDSSNGYALNHITDITGLSLSFQGDRTITVGTIDVTRDGSVELLSAFGSILDDGIETTHILGESVDLSSYGGDIGSSGGTGALDVVTEALFANAGEGGIFIHLPYPTNQSNLNNDINVANTNRAVTLAEVHADDSIHITLDNGDLRVSDLRSEDDVTLIASNGSILMPGTGGGFGFGIFGGPSSAIFADELTLSASHSVGEATARLVFNVPGDVTVNAGSGGIHLENEVNFSLLTATAVDGPIDARANRITAGAINAGTGAISLFTAEGMLDDGDGATRLTGGSVSLVADFGSIGAADSIIAVTTPDLSLSAPDSFYVDDNTGLSALDIATTGGGGHTYAINATGLTFNVTDDGSNATMTEIGNDTALDLEFSTSHTLLLGAIDTNAGSAVLASSGHIFDDGDVTTTITSPRLALISGGSIGASGAGNALAVAAQELVLKGTEGFYVDDSLALSSLDIETTGFNQTSFGLTAAGATLTISDNGSTQSLEAVSGQGLVDFSFVGNKNLRFGDITASGDVRLVTGNGTMTMDAGKSIKADTVTLDTLNSNDGHMGTSLQRIATDTPALVINSSGNVYVTNDQNLDSLAIEHRHDFIGNYAVSVAADNISNFSITDASTVVLSNIAATNMDFSFTTDRMIQANTINVGTGDVALTSRFNSSGAVIRDDNDQQTRITANSVSLRAAEDTSGHIGASGNGDIDVATANLSIRSTGNIYVADNMQLDSLEVTALHSELGNRTYSIAATNLTFTVTDQNLVNIGGQGTVITNVSNGGADLDFSWETDRPLQVVNINAAGGSVVLDTDYDEDFPGNAGSIYDDANSNTKIVADALTLRGRSAGSSPGSQSTELDASVSFLTTELFESLYLHNDGTLSLQGGTVGKNATITVEGGSILSGGTGRFVSDNLTLSAADGSIGANGNVLEVQSLLLALTTGYDLFVDNSADLTRLTVVDNHADVRTNTLSLTGRNLAFNVVDNGGNQFNVIDVGDDTGVDFNFVGDKTIQVGAVDVRGGNSLAIRATGVGSNIIDDGGNGATELTGAQITLNAAASVGLGNVVEVNTEDLTLVSGYALNVSSNLDLSALTVDLDQPGGSPAPTFSVVAPNLTFDVVDDGSITTINDITDTTGLNLTFDSGYSLRARTINTQRHGYVRLISDLGDLVGGNSGAERITAAQGTFETIGGGAIGTLANPLQISTPQVQLRATGDIYLASDTHIDTLSVEHRHGNQGAYAITSPSLTYTVSDTLNGLVITEITDTTGLDLRYGNDADITIGTINLSVAGDLHLGPVDSNTVNILGDGNQNTVITASGVDISSNNGDIGTSIAQLQISAQSFSGFADEGGLNVHFTGPVRIDSISVEDDSEVSADGDIDVGSFNADGNKVQISTTAGSIFGSVDDTDELTLTATGGSIGTESDPFSSSAYNEGTTTLNATATAGGIYIEEDYDLEIDSAVATGPIEIEADEGSIVLTTVTSSGGPVTLMAGEGGIFGTSQGANLITGTAVNLIAGDSGSETFSIGSSGTAIGVNTPVLTLNARGDMYVADQADLTSLTIERNADNSSAGGDFGITATNLTFTADDDGSTTTLTQVSDTTGLQFSFLANDALAVGIVNVGTNSDVTLQSESANGDGAINTTGQNPLITARNLTLNVEGFGSNIGSLQNPIHTAIASLVADAGVGGIYIEQNGTLLLQDVDSNGALDVETTSGNLVVGSISYGNNQPLSLLAAASLFDDGVNSTVIEGNGSGNIKIGAVNGIGDPGAPIVIEDGDFNTIDATVSGAGSAFLNLDSFANPIVNVEAADGSIHLNTNGHFTFGDVVSTTDALGNDITIQARNGDLVLGNLIAGEQHGVLLVNNASGSLYGRTPNDISAFDVTLLASGNIGGGTNNRLNVTGQSIAADSRFGNVYLGPTGIAVLGFVRALNGSVDVLGTSELLAANVLASSGITLATSGNSRIVAGNINAGNGPLDVSAPNGVIVDDGVLATRVIGGVGTFTAAGGIGNSITPLQTELAQVSATVTFNGGEIYINDISDLQINNLQTAGGDINVVTAGAMTGAGNINAGGQGIVLVAGEGGIDLSGDIVTTGNAQNAVVDLTADTIGVVNVTSTGAQGYHGDTTVGGDLSGGSVLIEGTLDLAGVGTREFEATATGGQITVEGVVDGNGAGLTLEALDFGSIDFLADASGLASLSANAMFMSFHDVLSSGAQNYMGDVRFYGDTYTTQGGSFDAGAALITTDTVITTNGGEVNFNDTVNSGHGQVGFSSFGLFTPMNGVTLPQDLTIDAGNADVIFASDIGNQAPLGALIVNSGGLTEFGGNITAGSVTTDAPGTARLLGAQATTIGAQTYGETLTVGNDTTFTGTTITFGGALNGTQAGEEEVYVVGDVVFSGGAGTGTQLALIDVTGTASLSGTLNTAGTQTYDGVITLTGDTTFQVGDDLTFDSVIDGAFNATVNAGTGSDVTFNSAVGSTTRLGALTINTDGITRFNNTVRAASVATDAPGSVIINTGTIDTTGTQTYADAGTLYVNTTLTGSSVNFSGALDDSGIGLHSLNIAGDASFGQVGANIALNSLGVSGTTLIGGSAIRTTAAQTYTGAVTVGADTELIASLATFNSTVNGTTAGQEIFNVKGNAVFNAGFGDTTALESVMIQGTAGLIGALNTAGTQRFHNTITLLGDTTSTTTNGDALFLTTVDGPYALTVNAGGNKSVIFNEEIGNTTRLGNLIVNTGGATSFNGSVRAASVTTDGPGTVELNGGLVDTTGAQSYGEIAVLGVNTTLKGTNVTFGNTVDSAFGNLSLSIEGNAVFGGAVGGQTSLSSLAVTGTTAVNGGSVVTQATQTYGGAVTIGADATLTAADDITFSSTVDGAHDVTVNSSSGDVIFQGAVGGASRLQDLAVNSAGETSFANVKAASIVTDVPGTVTFRGGTIDTTGTQSFGDATKVAGDTTLVAPTVQLLGVVNDATAGQHALTITGNAVLDEAIGGTAALRALSVSGTSAINGGVVTTSGAQTYGGAVTLGANTALTGSLITTNGNVNGTTIGAQSLSVTGNAVFNAGFGNQTALASVAVSGTSGVSGALNTVGGQTYGGAISLLGNTTLMAGEGDIAFNSTIDGAQAFTVDAGNNNVTFNGAVGGGVRLGALLVNSGQATTFNNSVRAASVTTDAAGSVALNGSGIDTTGAQSYGEVVTLGADATLTGSTVTFGGAINDATAGQHALTITGNGVFGSTVGATKALKALSVSGTSAVNGGSIKTTAGQTYGGVLTLGSNTTLTGSLVTTSGVNGTTAGQQKLDVVGNAVFNGGVGGQVSLASVDVSGTSGLAGTFNTLGTQNYQGAITLLGATTLSTSQNPITFASTIDGAQSLTVNAGSNAVSFNGAVGGTTRIGNLIVNTGGATTFNAPVRAASVTTDGPGSVALNGGSIDTSGAQIYGENLTLGADTTLTGTSVTLNGTVNSVTAGLRGLSIVGNGVFNAAVGNVGALKSLSVGGTSLLGGGSVVTTAGQNYGGAMTFNANTTLTSGGNVVFGSSVDTQNVSSLNIAAPSGSVSAVGAIGSTGPLNQFVLLSGLNATLGGITAKNIDVTVGTGASQFNGALNATTGAISIKNPSGTLVFAATAPIHAATGFTQTGGAVQLANNVSVTQGPISFGGPLTLVGNTIVMETDGDITFAGVSGLNTLLDVTAGTGVLKGGKRDGTTAEQIVLRDMIVNTAASAELFGSLSGIGGGGTAKFVKSMLVGPPYFFNDVPFGPLEFVDRLIVQTADQNTNATHYTVQSAAAEQTGEFPEQSIVQGLRAEPAPDLLGVEDEKNNCTVEAGCEVRTISIE